MSSRIKSSKSYNVILEYLNITILTENLDWENKILTLDKQIEFIHITIKYYNNPNSNDTTLPLLITQNPALIHNDIINYWDNLPNDYKKQIIKNHFITPLCIIDDTIILGVVVFGVEWKKYKLVETFNLLSVINGACGNVKGNVKGNEKFNYILGIVNNPINKELLESKTLKVDNKIINWYYIFQNISGYLPKLEIIYKKKQNASINFFQNRLNP
jgi:hypothetical protein